MLVKRKGILLTTMTLLLLLALVLTLVIPGSTHILRPNKLVKEVLVELPHRRQSPTVGAYRKNYRGDVVKIITNIGNSEATLPVLRFEDHNWEGHSIQLECNATYPVQWVYSGVGAPPVHIQTHRIVEDFFDKATYTYQATVLFTHTTEQQTGNYTCRSTDPNAQDLETFLYLFVPGSGVFIADVEEVHTVVASEDEPWLTLPCAVTDSDARVILLKKHSTEGVEVLHTGRHLTFDPKIGFQMQWHAFVDPWVSYICIGETEENGEVLNIEVKGPQPKKELQSSNLAEFESLSTKNPGIHLVTDEENNRLLCCSGTNDRPTLTSLGCSSIPDCDMRRKYLDAKKCVSSGSTNCEQHVANVGQSCVAYEMSDEHDESGMLRCAVRESAKYFYFSKEQNALITNFTKMPSVTQVLNIYVENSPKTGILFVSCHANSFFFAQGLKWAWIRPDGSMEMIPDQRPPAPAYLEVDKTKNHGSTLYCFAPVLNSLTEWKSKSIVIK